MLFSPLRSLVNRFSLTARSRRRHPSRPAFSRPRLETLVDRLAPATVNWSGGATGTGTNWNDPTNWVGNAVPGAADDAVIGSAFAGVTITATGNLSVHSVKSAAALVFNGQTFALGIATSVIDGGLTVTGGTLQLFGTTLTGLGTLTNHSDMGVIASAINTPFDNEGSVGVDPGTSAFNGPFTIGAAGSLSLRGVSNGNTQLTIASGFTNDGLIVMTSAGFNGGTTTLTVTSGILTNAADGTITASAGTGGGRVINAPLDNQGVLNVDTGMTLAAKSAAVLNSGTINVGGGASGLSINQSGASSSFTNTGIINVHDGNLTLNQPNATSVFTNSGTITLANGDTLFVAGGQFDPDSGSLNGVVQLNGVALGSGTLSSNAAVTLSGGSELAGAVLTNQGSLVIRGGTSFNGTFTNDVAGTLQVRSDVAQLATLTLANGLTNNGLIELVGIGSGIPAALTVTSGTLTNAAGATINIAPGFTGPRLLKAQLDNQGTINVNNGAGLTLTAPNGAPASTNSGTINVNDGDLTINQGPTGAFVNSGTINVSTNRTLFINGGEYDPDAGTVNGAVQLNSVALGSGTLSSNAVVTFITGSQLAGTTLVNQAQLFVEGGTSTFNGSFTNGANGLLQLVAGVNGTGPNAVLTVANDLTNNGVIQFVDLRGDRAATLTVVSGTLTNAPGALLETLRGSGGALTLAAQLDNQGTINLNQRLTIAKTGAAHTNSGDIIVRASLIVNQQGATASFDNTGTINARAGDVTFTQTGAQPSFTNDGEIDVGRGFTIAGGNFTNFADNTLTGGTYNITGTFTFTDAHILTNAATLVLDGVGGAVPRIQDQNSADALRDFASNSGAFSLLNGRSFSHTGDFSNTGTITVLGSTFTVNGAYTQTAGATILGSKATLTATGGVNLLGGVLSGSGTVSADVLNAAELDVGASGSTGVLTITKTYTQTADGTLHFDIGGALPGLQFDQLVINNKATLDGTLTVSLTNSFSPKPGASFKVLTFASVAGNFATVDIDQGGTFVLSSADGTVKF
jgi:hypothetical protein